MKWIDAAVELPEEDKPVICRVYYKCFLGGHELDYGAGVRYPGRDKISCERTGNYTVIQWMYDDEVTESH
jgi:hypothetical protein